LKAKKYVVYTMVTW